MSQLSNNLSPFWVLNLQPLISNDLALISGFVIGFILNIYNFQIVKSTIITINKYCMIFLNEFFVPLIPVFIFGYVVKLIDEKLFNTLLEQNLEVMIKMIGFTISYLVLHVFLISRFNFKKVIEIFKSLVSPMVTAFSTMSSAAALPFTLIAVNKNIHDKDYANFICPTTVNIHMVGDTICIPIIAILLMNFYGFPISNDQFLLFAIYFTLTKFSGAGVPGGTILVMLPVLEKTLGFTPEMCSLITSIYIVIDCITSSVNVAGNNIFALYIYPIYKKLIKSTI
ncbi:dicarboxylate symporter family protein [Rickettsia argasii T170-B]|uniref:Dicarboxylate symporter family protein n=2 Tax=Rickettsia argasii TaxID=1441385 RepID=A0A0F3RF36_9RICK|nr:dicarboxylate symporter family protein [Rickettsia argasii T170-B]